MDDSTRPKISQYPPHSRWKHPHGYHTKIVKDRECARQQFYCTFGYSAFRPAFIELSKSAQNLFLAMADTLIENGSNHANYHVERLVERTGLVKGTLYNAVSELRKAHFIKKVKRGRYLLNPSYVWAYDQDGLAAAVTAWNTWGGT